MAGYNRRTGASAIQSRVVVPLTTVQTSTASLPALRKMTRGYAATAKAWDSACNLACELVSRGKYHESCTQITDLLMRNGKLLSNPNVAPTEKEQLRLLASTAYLIRSASLSHLQMYPQSVKDASLAIHLNPLSDVGYNLRSYAFCRLMRYDLAWRDADTAIRLNPQNDSAYGNRASCAIHFASFDAAISDCNAALAINPENASARDNLFAATASRNKQQQITVATTAAAAAAATAAPTAGVAAAAAAANAVPFSVSVDPYFDIPSLLLNGESVVTEPVLSELASSRSAMYDPTRIHLPAGTDPAYSYFNAPQLLTVSQRPVRAGVTAASKDEKSAAPTAASAPRVINGPATASNAAAMKLVKQIILQPPPPAPAPAAAAAVALPVIVASNPAPAVVAPASVAPASGGVEAAFSPRDDTSLAASLSFREDGDAPSAGVSGAAETAPAEPAPTAAPTGNSSVAAAAADAVVGAVASLNAPPLLPADPSALQPAATATTPEQPPADSTATATATGPDAADLAQESVPRVRFAPDTITPISSTVVAPPPPSVVPSQFLPFSMRKLTHTLTNRKHSAPKQRTPTTYRVPATTSADGPTPAPVPVGRSTVGTALNHSAAVRQNRELARFQEFAPSKPAGSATGTANVSPRRGRAGSRAPPPPAGLPDPQPVAQWEIEAAANAAMQQQQQQQQLLQQQQQQYESWAAVEASREHKLLNLLQPNAEVELPVASPPPRRVAAAALNGVVISGRTTQIAQKISAPAPVIATTSGYYHEQTVESTEDEKQHSAASGEVTITSATASGGAMSGMYMSGPAAPMPHSPNQTIIEPPIANPQPPPHSVNHTGHYPPQYVMGDGPASARSASDTKRSPRDTGVSPRRPALSNATSRSAVRHASRRARSSAAAAGGAVAWPIHVPTEAREVFGYNPLHPIPTGVLHGPAPPHPPINESSPQSARRSAVATGLATGPRRQQKSGTVFVSTPTTIRIEKKPAATAPPQQQQPPQHLAVGSPVPVSGGTANSPQYQFQQLLASEQERALAAREQWVAAREAELAEKERAMEEKWRAVQQQQQQQQQQSQVQPQQSLLQPPPQSPPPTSGGADDDSESVDQVSPLAPHSRGSTSANASPPTVPGPGAQQAAASPGGGGTGSASVNSSDGFKVLGADVLLSPNQGLHVHPPHVHPHDRGSKNQMPPPSPLNSIQLKPSALGVPLTTVESGESRRNSSNLPSSAQTPDSASRRTSGNAVASPKAIGGQPIVFSAEPVGAPAGYPVPKPAEAKQEAAAASAATALAAVRSGVDKELYPVPISSGIGIVVGHAMTLPPSDASAAAVNTATASERAAMEGVAVETASPPTMTAAVWSL